VIGNGADNILIAMRGNDVMTGGGGTDQFLFSAGFGSDLITDFVGDLFAGAGSGDVIDFSGVSEVTNFTAFSGALTAVGSDLVYDFGGDGADVLTFAGLGAGDLLESDFVFAEDPFLV
jgi:hypothetical protein